MQNDDSLLRSFVTIKPAAEKILSDRTAKYRRARTKSREYLSVNRVLVAIPNIL